MSVLIAPSRRAFLSSVTSATAALVLASPAMGLNLDRRVIDYVRWQKPGNDRFSDTYKDAPRAVRALEGLTEEEQRYFIKAVEPLADAGYDHPDTALFIIEIRQDDEWREMVNGRTRARYVRDEPSVWKPSISRRQYVATLTDEYTGVKVEVSIPEVCCNARHRKLKPGQVRCIPIPVEKFDRIATTI